jgi:hypothetical protein
MFERLTRWENNDKDVAGLIEEKSDFDGLTEAVTRLAEYEDSELSPEEVQELAKAKADGRLVVLPETGIGDLSDGYHTFNELYHHRAVLFSVICNAHPEMAWKSKLHHDGTMYDGMFIVGIQTPEGQATYHYDIDPYWEMFNVQELPQAPEWDGHTPAQAIERIGKLNTQPENSRQHALQTGVCPMCEDCPDGCPVETPKDSRNIVTNADRIRSMSDEELAWEFMTFRLDAYGKAKRDETVLPDSQKAILNWLKQPVKEEHNETDRR